MISKRLAMALVVAVFATTAATSPSTATAQAPSAGDQIRIYYNDVKNLFREAAKLLGQARGPAERAPLITLQKYCSRSLAGIRQKLNEAELKANADTLVGPAQADYESCKQAFDKFGRG